MSKRIVIVAPRLYSMLGIQVSPEERAEAIARLNASQQARNCYTNIGEREVAREVKRARARK